MPPLVSRALTVPLISRLKETFPGITLRIHEAMTGALRGMMASDGLDLAIMHTLLPGEFPNARLLLAESLLVLTSSKKTYWQGQQISVADLARIPLVVTTMKNSHRQVLESLAKQNDISLQIVAEVDSVPRTIELVMEGIGAMVTSPSNLSEWPADRISVAALRGTEHMWHTNLVVPKQRENRRGIEAVAELIAEIVQERYAHE